MNVTELHTRNTYSFDHTTKKRKCWNETKKIIIFVVDVGNVMPCNLAFFYDDRQTYWGPWESKFRKNKIRIFELQFTSLNVCFNGYTPFIRMSCNCKCSIRRTFRLGTMPSMYGKNTLLSSSMHGNLIAIHSFFLSSIRNPYLCQFVFVEMKSSCFSQKCTNEEKTQK